MAAVWPPVSTTGNQNTTILSSTILSFLSFNICFISKTFPHFSHDLCVLTLFPPHFSLSKSSFFYFVFNPAVLLFFSLHMNSYKVFFFSATICHPYHALNMPHSSCSDGNHERTCTADYRWSMHISKWQSASSLFLFLFVCEAVVIALEFLNSLKLERKQMSETEAWLWGRD